MDLVQGQGMVPTASKKAICASESTTNPSEDSSGNTRIYDSGGGRRFIFPTFNTVPAEYLIINKYIKISNDS